MEFDCEVPHLISNDVEPLVLVVQYAVHDVHLVTEFNEESVLGLYIWDCILAFQFHWTRWCDDIVLAYHGTDGVWNAGARGAYGLRYHAGGRLAPVRQRAGIWRWVGPWRHWQTDAWWRCDVSLGVLWCTLSQLSSQWLLQIDTGLPGPHQGIAESTARQRRRRLQHNTVCTDG